MKNQGFNIINYNFNNKLLNKNSLFKVIQTFFKDILSPNPDRYYFVILKIEFDNGSFKSLHKGLLLKNDSLLEYFNYIYHVLSIKSDEYQNDFILNIIFNYFIIEVDKEKYFLENRDLIIPKDKIPLKLEKFSNGTITHNLPLDMNYQNWGWILHDSDNSLIILNNDNYVYNIFNNNDHFLIRISKNKNDILSFTDKIIDNKMFIRSLDKTEYYIKNNNIVLTIKQLKTEFLKPINPVQFSDPKIITIDIETIVRDNTHFAYLYSMFDGNKSFSWFNSSPKLLFDKLLSPKYRNYHIYAHNLSRFDIVFLLKYIASLKNEFKIDILTKDGKYISIKIYNYSKNISITIKDSYLLLPSSLEKLAKQFNCLNKGIEPVLIGNKDSEYNLESIHHYSKEVEQINDIDIWKIKIVDYCERDCISLYQVLIEFRKLVFNQWSILIDKYPTTPSLAFAIFRTHYLSENTIPLTKGDTFDFIRESFTGGSTEIYKPYGKDIFVYDVNSLYPFIMKNSLFPIGKIYKFEGDITILKNYYWIGDVDIETKKDLYQPYIQVYHKTKEVEK